MFEKIKKLFRKGETKMAEKEKTTLEMVRKAYEDLNDDDKRAFEQSIADRVHESIAAQERAEGDEDSQSAEAREHEALGEEHAEGKGDVEELHESDDTEEEKAEDERHERAEEEHEERQEEKHENSDERLSNLERKMDALIEMLSVKSSSVEEKAKETYGLGNGVFQADDKGNDTKKTSVSEIAGLLAKIKR